MSCFIYAPARFLRDTPGKVSQIMHTRGRSEYVGRRFHSIWIEVLGRGGRMYIIAQSQVGLYTSYFKLAPCAKRSTLRDTWK